MFAHRRGPLFDWLKGQRDMSDCGQGSPVAQLARLKVLDENFLAVHVNYLAPGDAPLLARRRVSVVHCPRSHAYFRHQRFPRAELAAAGGNLCLGTDSLASANKVRGQSLRLDMWAELRALASNSPGLPPEAILPMATWDGARALGL